LKLRKPNHKELNSKVALVETRRGLRHHFDQTSDAPSLSYEHVQQRWALGWTWIGLDTDYDEFVDFWLDSDWKMFY